MKENFTFRFGVYYPGERAAGIHSFSDGVEVSLRSGDPGGEPGEFAEHIRSALEEWFDGATVWMEE
jgi:hypothetical protein